MLPNHEFIKNRSVEISWAVFRCTSLFKNEKLKNEIESVAIDLAANYDKLNLKETHPHKIHGQIPFIEKLISLLKLAEAIGDIKPINSKVLHRELNNLIEVIKNDIAEAVRVIEEGANFEIEGIFSKPPAILFADLPIKKEANNSAKAELSSAITQAKESIRQDKDEDNSVLNHNSAIRQTTHDNSARATFSAEKATFNTAKAKINPTDDTDIQESWQELIYKKVREIGKISTRELCAHFPQISERTIRFYLQKLMENGLIDRIGSTGPGSYYVHRSFSEVV